MLPCADDLLLALQRTLRPWKLADDRLVSTTNLIDDVLRRFVPAWRRCGRPGHWPHSHHVHLVEAGGAEERRTLAFRDYLRDHPAAARDYEELKRDLGGKLAATTNGSCEAYAQAKTDFIERVLEVALSSGYPLEPFQGEVAQQIVGSESR